MYHNDPVKSSLLQLIVGFLEAASTSRRHDSSNNNNNSNSESSSSSSSLQKNSILFWRKFGVSKTILSISSSKTTTSSQQQQLTNKNSKNLKKNYHHNNNNKEQSKKISLVTFMDVIANNNTNNSNSNSNNNSNSHGVNDIENVFVHLKVIETLLFQVFGQKQNNNNNNTKNSSFLPITTTTQRDIYYSFVELLPRRDQSIVSRAIENIATVLNIPRHGLGVFASTRGFVAGTIIIGENDLSLTNTSMAIPGEFAALTSESLESSYSSFSSQKQQQQQNSSSHPKIHIEPKQSRCILIVEKDSVFQRLVAEKIWEKFPMIIITGRGFPDIATRVFVSRLSSSSSSLPVYGLVDYNPSGVRILYVYRYGPSSVSTSSTTTSTTTTTNSSYYNFAQNNNNNNSANQNNNNDNNDMTSLTCPSLRWLGTRSNDTCLVSNESQKMKLTSLSVSKGKSLQRDLMCMSSRNCNNSKNNNRNNNKVAHENTSFLSTQEQKQQQEYEQKQQERILQLKKQENEESALQWHGEVTKMLEGGICYDLEAIPDLENFVLHKVISRDAI